jgi:hypothetical protein
MPSLSIVLPIHNSNIFTPKLLVQVLKEDIPTKNSGDLVIWVESDPPSYVDFSMAGIVELSLNSNKTITSITATIKNTNIIVSVDVGLFRQNFGSDSKDSNFVEANERVLKLKRTNRISEININLMNESLYSNSILISYHIKVLTYNRPKSLGRLLRSLNEAEYIDHNNITLEILIDGAKTKSVISSVFFLSICDND